MRNKNIIKQDGSFHLSFKNLHWAASNRTEIGVSYTRQVVVVPSERPGLV